MGLFDVNKDKITERALLQSLIVSVLGILLCIVLLCSATFAWFNGGAESDKNTIAAGHYDLFVSVTLQDGTAPADGDVELIESADGEWICTFNAAGRYLIRLSMTDDTTISKGFCHLYINGATEPVSAGLISRDPALGDDPFVFTLDIRAAGTSVRLDPRWGAPALDPDIVPDSVYTVTGN